MKLDTLRRLVASMSRLAGALMLCALPALAQDEDSEAAPAQQGGHYEAGQDDGQAETEEAPAPIPQPAARTRTVPRVFRARPAGGIAETNQEAASSAVEDGESLGGAGVSQGAADKKIGQGAGSASGSGGGPGSCAWTSEISPTPTLYPALPCSSSNAGAVSPNSQNQGSFTCVCDSGGSGSSSGKPNSGSSSVLNGIGSPGCNIADSKPGSYFYIDFIGGGQDTYFIGRARCYALRSDLAWSSADPEGVNVLNRIRTKEGHESLLREKGLLDVVDANRQLGFSGHLTGVNGVLSSPDGGFRAESGSAIEKSVAAQKYQAVLRGISMKEYEKAGLNFHGSAAHNIGEAAWNKYGNDVQSGRLTLGTLALIPGVTARRIRSK